MPTPYAHVPLEEEDPTLTEAGWPRPVIDGWPIPWVSPPGDLKQVDGPRLHQVIAETICQVCGTAHQPGTRVFLCADTEATDETSLETDLSTVTVYAMDEAVMHERCARLAVGVCPKLRRLREAGELIVLSTPVEHIEILMRAGTTSVHLAVPGEYARVECWDVRSR